MLICAFLTAVTLAAFWSVKDAAFVNFDDPRYVSQNLIVQKGLTVENLRWAFTTFYFNNWHPLTWLSFMADCEFFGLSARAFHLVNLAFHVGNTLLLFLFLTRTTAAIWPSCIVAGFFGIHPLHVESVAWVAERKDVLSTFFWLLTMWAYHVYVKRKRACWYVASLMLFCLGLMSKAMLVTLPFVLMLLDLWPLRRIDGGTRDWLARAKPLLWEKAPFILLAAAASYLAYRAQGEAVASTEGLAFASRLENVFVSYARYISKTFWPTDLSVFYPHPVQWPEWQVWGSLALVFAASVLAFFRIREAPYLFTGWFWFLGTLVPVIGLVQIGGQSIADRYMYVPSMGLFIALVWTAREFTAHERVLKGVAAACAVIALAACCFVTMRQVEHWKSSLALFTHAERVTGPNVTVLNNLGNALLASGRKSEADQKFLAALAVDANDPLAWGNTGKSLLEQGDTAKAIEHFRSGLKLQPNNPELNHNLGLALARSGNFKEAISYYLKAISNKPAYVDAHINLGAAFLAVGDTASALTNCLTVVRLKPDFAPGHYNLATTYLEAGQFDKAELYYREAIRLKYEYSDAYRQLGVVLARKKDPQEARAALEKAIRFNPKDALARVYLAGVLAETGQTERAIAEYREILRSETNAIVVLNNLAWLRATHPEARFRDGSEAVRLAERACELTQRSEPFLLGTLAAAYAEVGRFDDAIKTAEQAIQLAEAHGKKSVAEKNRELLTSYRGRQPWREPAQPNQ
ncbi:MAG: tetratricopeptide repeat protein [Verrucomicrobia subdivision 3 bacterium]|nr:tetratricopeptide repeat protein [Limisphaerales bacterium]